MLPSYLAGCAATPESGTDGASAVAVTSTDAACEITRTEAPSGPLTFSVTNSGNQVTEFYLLGDDQLRIVGEVENIGPGISRDLVVQAAPGEYYTACKPGMVGEGIRAPFTVTDSGAAQVPAGKLGEQVKAATKSYEAYVRDQTQQLVADTGEFVAAYVAGDDERARQLYADARTHWERIEPVAESFGDLDPKLDLREADLEPGQVWTGWHLIEKDLWPPAKYQPLTQQERRKAADLLVADTADLDKRVGDLTLTVDQIGNGAKELLDEVATSKVTGEEEFWSHTDLWDVQANVDGARVMFETVKPIVEQRNPQLADELVSRFAKMQKVLDQYRSGDGFVLYTDLTPAQVKNLAEAVDALSEPLSQLTATVVS